MMEEASKRRGITAPSGFEGSIFARPYEEIVQMSLSEDPNKRYWAVLCSGFENVDVLERLTQDDCWLVRHGAKRLLDILDFVHKINYGKQPISWSQDDLWERNAWGISDVVYELYLEDWKHTHSDHQLRMEDIRDWGKNMEPIAQYNYIPDDYEDWKIDGCSSIEQPLDYDSFCGYNQPLCFGIYQNRDYVARLLDYDDELLEMYDKDINDSPEKKLSVSDIVRHAAIKCSQMKKLYPEHAVPEAPSK